MRTTELKVIQQQLHTYTGIHVTCKN